MSTIPDEYAFLNRDGDLRASVRNWGNEPAFSVEVVGAFCTLKRASPGKTDLGIGEQFAVLIALSDDNLLTEHFGIGGLSNAYVMITWVSPSSHRDRRLAAWFPVDEEGELAAIRARQLARGRIRQAVARYTTSPIPMPGSIPFGHVPATPPPAPQLLSPESGPPKAMPLRRGLQKLFRVEPEWPAFEQAAFE